MSSPAERIRPPAVAGQFYPGSAKALRRDVDAMLACASDTSLSKRIVALLAPHAGYVYSGLTAAHAYRQVQGISYDAVIVLAPSHRDTFSGVSVMARGAYSTPLGTMPIHEQIADRLIESDRNISDMREGHELEHAVEVQLPFIQRAIGDVPIVPIVMLDRTWPLCQMLADTLVKATDGFHVLVVASSDLYHGYSESECQSFDERTLHEAESATAQEFCGDLEHGRVQACGGGPIAVVKEYVRLQGASGVRVLSHTTSAEVTGAVVGYVVGYGAVAYHYTDDDVRDTERHSDGRHLDELSEEERTVLGNLVRQAVCAAAREEPLPVVPTDYPRLLAPQGAFVTIRNKGELRGCIGKIVADTALAETVIHMAEAAACHDMRFAPVRADELDDLTLDISVMSLLWRIDSPEEIVVGTHGLVASGRSHRGLLLPQVAVEQKWNRTEFLNHTCLKAGLPSSAWRDDDITLEVFTAQVFHA